MAFQRKITKLVFCFTTAVLGVTFLYFSNRRRKLDEKIEKCNASFSLLNLSSEIDKIHRISSKFFDSSYLNAAIPLEKELLQVDNDLEKNEHLESCLRRLKKLQTENAKNPTILWMIGKTYLKISENVPDATEKRKNIEKGIEACKASLKLNFKQANAHKWMAILIGSRSLLQPLKEKILDAHTFKQHADIALGLNSSDFYLHFMVGRYCYDIASMKWYERKVAAALFAEPPKATFEEALEHLLKAEKLAQEPSKETRYFLGKSYLSLGNNTEGLKWLREAAKIKSRGKLDDALNEEIKIILKQHIKKS